MGVVRGRSALARLARRLWREGKSLPPDGSRSEWIEPADLTGVVLPSASLEPPDVVVPVDGMIGRRDYASEPSRYPRHGFGQEWPR